MEVPQAVVSDLLSHEKRIRIAAMRTLVKSGKPQGGATAIVIRMSIDRDEEVRSWACEALESVVVPNADEVPELTELLRSTCDGEVEYWTATMIGRIGGAAGGAAGALASCLLDSRCLAARERAAWALSELGPAARSATNALRQIGPEDPPRLQRLAATALDAISAARAA